MISDDLRAILYALSIVRIVSTDAGTAPALSSIVDALADCEARLRCLEAGPIPAHWKRQPSDPTSWPENVTPLRRGMI